MNSFRRCWFGEKILWVQDIPKNGACLFGAITHQWDGLHPELQWQQFIESTQRLRETIVHFIRDHLADFQDFLVPFADDLGTSAKVEDFLSDLSKPTVWAGEESLAAASRMLPVTIELWDLRTWKVRTFPCRETSAGVIRMTYDGTHYNSIVSVGTSCPEQRWVGKYT